MRVCGGRGEFADGVPIASICTGWGVAEMVLDCLNEKLAEMDPKLAKARTVLQLILEFFMHSCLQQISFFPQVIAPCWSALLPCPVLSRLHVREWDVESWLFAQGFSWLQVHFQWHAWSWNWQSSWYHLRKESRSPWSDWLMFFRICQNLCFASCVFVCILLQAVCLTNFSLGCHSFIDPFSRYPDIVVMSEAEGVVAGYPCRSLSLQNNNPKSFTDKSSSTGGGFHSTMRYVKRNQRLKWVLLENVQGMFHVRKKFGNECPMEIQGKQMRKMGFKEVFAFLLNSSDYGLAHSRPRAWVLYIREDQIRSFAIIWYRFDVKMISWVKWRWCFFLTPLPCMELPLGIPLTLKSARPSTSDSLWFELTWPNEG